MSRRTVFVDAAFVQALLNRADQYHGRAVAWMAHLRDPRRWVDLLTTEAVLTEIGNALSATNRAAAVDFIRQAYQTPNLMIVSVDRTLFDREVALYAGRPDKAWGLTDCISFVAMDDRGVSEALTPDHHCEQAGFVALLRRDPP